MMSRVALLLLLLPAMAHAHVLQGAGFLAGVAHPVGGADHLIAMVAVGLVSTRGGRTLVVGIPAAFLAGMALGFVCGLAWPGLTHVEQAIVGSVVMLGMMLAFPAESRATWLAALVVVGFGWCHGYAHGQEWPGQASPVPFALGFLGTSAGLHAIGVITGLLYRESQLPARSFAITGFLIAAAGATMGVAGALA